MQNLQIWRRIIIAKFILGYILCIETNFPMQNRAVVCAIIRRMERKFLWKAEDEAPRDNLAIEKSRYIDKLAERWKLGRTMGKVGGCVSSFINYLPCRGNNFSTTMLRRDHPEPR